MPGASPLLRMPPGPQPVSRSFLPGHGLRSGGIWQLSRSTDRQDQPNRSVHASRTSQRGPGRGLGRGEQRRDRLCTYRFTLVKCLVRHEVASDEWNSPKEERLMSMTQCLVQCARTVSARRALRVIMGAKPGEVPRDFVPSRV
jgi:hypothetical protein